MRTPAVSRFGAFSVLPCVVLFACWRSAPPPSSLDNTANNSGPPDLTASYWCAIEEGGYRYPDMPCTVRQVAGRWVLEKMAGSQRFRGEIAPRGEGFAFAGEVYCPWGDCVQPLHGEFRPSRDGSLRGRFTDNAMSVILMRAGDGAFGGASYGGDGYGGFGYGGFGYGGRNK